MAPTKRSFRVADVEVALSTASPNEMAALSGYYDLYPPAGGAPDLMVEFRVTEGFRAPRAKCEYPGFDCQATGPGSMRLNRTDGVGTVNCPDDPSAPVTASFEVASTTALESAIRIAMSVTLPRLGGLIMHASAVADGDRALVFAGRSGAGKSTIAELLQTAYPRLLKLSDELLLLRRDDSGRWCVHVAPFHGVQGLPHGHASFADGIHFIAHAPSHVRTPLPPAAAVPQLLRHTLAYAPDAATTQRALDVGTRLCTDVPCFTLQFARDTGVAEVLGISSTGS